MSVNVTFESQSETKCALSCKIQLCRPLLGQEKLELIAFTVNPAVQKILSDGALVAGMARIARASFDNLGKHYLTKHHLEQVIDTCVAEFLCP